jgi:hypothetical protein
MILETPLGRLEFGARAVGRQLTHADVSFRLVEVHEELPPGMAVESLSAVLVQLRPRSRLRDVRVTCRWLRRPPVSGTPESGERLEAQSWKAAGFVVMVGTEDFEALASRHPSCRITEVDNPVRYHADGIEVRLPVVPAMLLTSLHFAVAVNPLPEPAECSSWYAVDIQHGKLLKTAAAP